MKKFKNVAAALLALVLLAGMLCVPAGAEDVPLIDVGTWNVYLNAGEVAIGAFIPEASTQYFIGSYVSGVPASQYAVLNENGDVLKHEKDGVYINMEAGTVYYILIGFWSETQSGYIDFHIYDSATELSASSTGTYGLIMSEEYATWYRFTPERTNYYTLETVNVAGDYSKPTVTLYDSKGKQLASTAGSTLEEGFRLSASLRQGNTYYYKIEYSPYLSTCEFMLKMERYPDVSPNLWYYEAAEYVSERGFMSGYASGLFGPANNMHRQDFVLILARVAGVDLDAYKDKEVTMPDVVPGSYYAAAVAWAAENGVVSGYQNGYFGVSDPITREQVCTILYRFVGSPEVENVEETLARFPDRAVISEYAEIPTAWAVQNGVVSGMASGKMAPVAKASRAQAAVIVTSMHKQGMFDGQEF